MTGCWSLPDLADLRMVNHFKLHGTVLLKDLGDEVLCWNLAKSLNWVPIFENMVAGI